MAPHLVSSASMSWAWSSRVPGRGSPPSSAMRARICGSVERGVERAVELLADVAREPAGGDHAVVDHRDVAGHAGLGEGRQVGEQRRAGLAGDRDRPKLGAAHRAEHRRQRGDHHVDAAGDEVGQGRAGAAERHVGELDAGHGGEQLGRQMRARADAGARIGELAGLALGDGDQVGEGVDRQRRMHHQHLLERADQPDRGKILARIVARIGVEARRDAEHAGVADHQGVAVVRALCDRACAGGAAGAGAVLDHDCRPSEAPMRWASRRASTSLPPPAANGTTMTTGRVG